MASLLFAVPVFAYEKLKDSKAKRAARRAENASRFSELENANRKRIEALQQNTPFCTTSDWQGGGCPVQRSDIRAWDSSDDMQQRRHGDFQGDEDMQMASQPPDLNRQLVGPEIRRENTFATTGTTENALIDSYHDEAGESDEELLVPDVRHVVPPKYEDDVRIRKDGWPYSDLQSITSRLFTHPLAINPSSRALTTNNNPIASTPIPAPPHTNPPPTHQPMASLLFAGGVLAYEKIKDAKAKKTARKAHNAARYSDLQSSTCTCTHPHNTPAQEKNTKGCPVHDPEARRKSLKEEEEREREELIKGKGKGKGEKATYNGDEDEGGDFYHGEPRRRDDVTATGASGVGREDAPPRYEDVAAAPVAPVGFEERIR